MMLTTVSRWTINLLRAQIGLVYLFAGIAKLQPDWLIRAMPMKIWLAARAGLPLIGPWLIAGWTPYLMSWGGAIYDLTIIFLLLYKPTRRYAFIAVVGFHLATAFLFPQIGIFPYIMIICPIIFFTREYPRSRCMETAPTICQPDLPIRELNAPNILFPPLILSSCHLLTRYLLLAFVLLQIALPLRHWLYPGNVLWNEEGFRYAWKVMLVEKTGRTAFIVTDPVSDRSWPIYPNAYLTQIQETQMAYQPDMILEFAHFLQAEMAQLGIPNVEVWAKSYVSYNGRPSRLLIDPTVDLAKERNGLWPKPWIME